MMDNSFVDKTKEKNLGRFHNLFETYGVDERSLGSTKKKNRYRYSRMLDLMNIKSGDLLDIGSGFGDLYGFLSQDGKYKNVNYQGIEFVPEFVEVAKHIYPDGRFESADFMTWTTDKRFDYVFQCGCFFNLDPDDEDSSYDYIDTFIKKVLSLLNENGVAAFHFMTDKVDYKTSDLDFCVNPERITSIAYRYSRRIILDNGFFPFEACLIVFKNDSFRKETTIFTNCEEMYK